MRIRTAADGQPRPYRGAAEQREPCPGFAAEAEPREEIPDQSGLGGQPRDRDRRSAFALYDSKKHEIRFYRVPYDIKRAQERILQAGLPQMLASRLGRT